MTLHHQHPDRERPASRLAWLVGPAFFLLAVWFVWFAPAAEIPASGTQEIGEAALGPTARPTVKDDPPVTRVGAYEYRCSDCHRVFQNEAEKTAGRVQHTEIVLDHGLNDRCLHCHSQADRDRLVARDGAELSYAQIPELCAQCHGTTYRDWQRGTHGKTLGSWQRASPERRRLTCSECHDPHAPAFEPEAPLPGPQTLRMGDPPAGHRPERAGPLSLPFVGPGGARGSGEGGAGR